MAGEGNDAGTVEFSNTEDATNPLGIDVEDEGMREFNKKSDEVSRKLQEALGNTQQGDAESEREAAEQNTPPTSNDPNGTPDGSKPSGTPEGEGGENKEPENPYAKRAHSKPAESGENIAEQVAKAVSEQMKPIVEQLQRANQASAPATQPQADGAPNGIKLFREFGADPNEEYTDYLNERADHYRQQGVNVPDIVEERKWREAATKPPAENQAQNQTQNQTQEKTGQKKYRFITEAVATQSLEALKAHFNTTEWNALLKADGIDYDFIPAVLSTPNPKMTAQAIEGERAEELRKIANSGNFVAMNDKIAEIAWDAAHGKLKSTQNANKKGNPEGDDTIPNIKGTPGGSRKQETSIAALMAEEIAESRGSMGIDPL